MTSSGKVTEKYLKPSPITASSGIALTTIGDEGLCRNGIVEVVVLLKALVETALVSVVFNDIASVPTEIFDAILLVLFLLE
jgi:hypothetical protein